MMLIMNGNLNVCDSAHLYDFIVQDAFPEKYFPSNCSVYACSLLNNVILQTTYSSINSLTISVNTSLLNCKRYVCLVIVSSGCAVKLLRKCNPLNKTYFYLKKTCFLK